MRSHSAQWFECTIKYEKTQEDGMLKKVSETYTVDALSFTEAESRIMNEMSSYISGEFEVSAIRKAPYKDVFFSDNDSADKWYIAKLTFITIDERTDKERKSTVTYLVNAANIKKAMKNVDDIMGTTMIDYETCEVKLSKILDVYEYKDKTPEYEKKQNDKT